MNRLQPLTSLREDAGHVAERSWGVRWSRSGVVFWHRRETFGFSPVNERRTRGRGGWVAAGVVGLASIAATAVGVVAGPVSPRPAAAPLVSVQIPPVKPLLRKAAPVEPRPAVAEAAQQRAASVITTDTPPETPLVERSGEEPIEAAPIRRQADAVDAAIRSGRMRSWVDADEGVQGFVVVGDAETENGRTCRDLSILIKGDGESKVSRDRRCIRS